jgi:hypothetical protein
MMMPFRLFFMLLLLPLLVKSQGRNVRTDTVLIKPFTITDTVGFDIGTNRLYFDAPLLLKYLKTYDNYYTWRKSSIAALMDTLQKSKHQTFFLRDTTPVFRNGQLDTASISNKYWVAISEFVPDMLLAGQVTVLEDKSRLVPYLIITRFNSGNIVGPFMDFRVYLPNGKILEKDKLIPPLRHYLRM